MRKGFSTIRSNSMVKIKSLSLLNPFSAINAPDSFHQFRIFKPNFHPNSLLYLNPPSTLSKLVESIKGNYKFCARYQYELHGFSKANNPYDKIVQKGKKKKEKQNQIAKLTQVLVL